MFLAVTKRLRRTNGLGVVFGIRITRRNVLWLGLIWFTYILCYYMMWLSIWFIIALVYGFFIWPFKKIRNLVNGRNRAVDDSVTTSTPPQV